MFRKLLKKIHKSAFHSSQYVLSRFLHRHLPSRQAQVQRGARALAVLLVHNGMKVHQIRVEDMQPALEFLKLVLEFAFYLWSLTGFVADVDIHRVPRHLGEDPERRSAGPQYVQILHLKIETHLEFSALSWKLRIQTEQKLPRLGIC